MTKQRRWIRSVLEASKGPVPALPWARATRPVRAPVHAMAAAPLRPVRAAAPAAAR